MKPAATCRQRGLACQNAETKECADQCAMQGLSWISRPTPPTPPRPQPLTLLNCKPYSCHQLGLCQNPYRLCEGGLCEIEAARLASVDLLRAHYSATPPSWHQTAGAVAAITPGPYQTPAAPANPPTTIARWLTYQAAAAAILGLACGFLYGLAQWLGH